MSKVDGRLDPNASSASSSGAAERLAEPPGEPRSWLEWIRSMPYLAISAALHLVLVLFLIGMTVSHSAVTPDGGGVIQFTCAAALEPSARSKPKPFDPRLPREPEKARPLPIHDALAEIPFKVVREEDLDAITTDKPHGMDKSAKTNLSTDFSYVGLETGVNPSIGVGRDVAGAVGDPYWKGRITHAGAPPLTEDLVLAALDWLRRHQSEDGSWKASGFTEKCRAPCSNSNAAKYGKGVGFEHMDVGVTGLAILAFAGHGHTHRDGLDGDDSLVPCVRKAADYLRRIQVRSEDPATDGRYGPADHEQWIYNHAIATLAMCELYLMTGDTIGLKRSVEAAVRLCLRAQNDGMGWRYGMKPGENDSSVTGWMVLALKTAKNANLSIPPEEYERSFRGALSWFDRATSASGKTGYMAPGDEGSRLSNVFAEPYPYSKEPSCMTAVSVLCRLFAGESRSNSRIRGGVKILAENMPKWSEARGRALSSINFYYWYYGSYAMFQFGGTEWARWSDAMIEALQSTQRTGVCCETGSWDPVDEWGPAGGRVYSTALGAMTLEVYYRFKRM